MSNELSTIVTSNQALVTRFNSEISEILKKEENLSLSVFQGAPATPEDIVKSILVLKAVWPMTESFYGVLKGVIARSGMTTAHLQAAVDNLLQTHKYGNSFTPAELVSFDLKIPLARSIAGLRSMVDRQLDWEDIVIVEFNQERRFTLRDEAVRYKLNILAEYEDPGIIKWVGTYNNPDFFARRKAFGNAIKEFVDKGTYPREMCLDFYNYWSKPVMCGDTMLKEIRWSNNRRDKDGNLVDLTGEYLEEWYQTKWLTKQQNNEKSES